MRRPQRPSGKLPFAVLDWWSLQAKDYPYAAFAHRQLRFRRVNELCREKVPTEPLGREWRIYLFRNGETRDDFVEAFHEDYDAHGAQWK